MVKTDTGPFAQVITRYVSSFYYKNCDRIENNMRYKVGHTIEVDENIYNALISSVGKEHMEKRMEQLLLASIEGMLEDYTKKILKFEEKYGMAFSGFESLWDSDMLKDKHSHEIESDYIDWEMMEMEKKELLTILAKLKRKRD